MLGPHKRVICFRLSFFSAVGCPVLPAILPLKFPSRRQLFRFDRDPFAKIPLPLSAVSFRQLPRPPHTRIPRNKKAVRRRSNAALPLSA